MDRGIAVVLHPVHTRGLVEAFSGRPDVSLSVADTADDVVDLLESGAVGLLTYEWEDRFVCGDLRWVQAMSAGVEQFSQPLLRDRKIVLTSASGAHTPAVAEHAIALMMAVVRGIGPAVRGAAERNWNPIRAYEVEGRTMAILGLGSIGEAVARKASALGIYVIGTKRDISDYRGVADEVLPEDQTREACRRADVLVIALPGGRSTLSLVGDAELAALGTGWLINVGRGTVIDEGALVRALTDGDLRGAALDVTSVEPLPDASPLWDLPNVIITPHIGWSSDRLAARLVEITVANARALHDGVSWTNRIV